MYDVGSGIISPLATNNAIGSLQTALNTIQVLTDAERTGDICTISFDIDNNTDGPTNYFLKKVQFKPAQMSDDGKTLEFSANLNFIEAGNEVIQLQ